MRLLERRVLAWDANAMILEENFARFKRFLTQGGPSKEMLPAQLLRAAQPEAPVCVAQPLGAEQVPITVQQDTAARILAPDGSGAEGTSRHKPADLAVATRAEEVNS